MSIRREPRRVPSVARKVVITLILVGALLVALDFGSRLWAQSWLAGRVQDALATESSTEIELHGFPFLAQFAAGRFDGAEVSVAAVDSHGLLLRSIHLDLEDVSFPRGSLVSRGSGRIHVGSGDGEVVVPEDSLSAYLLDRGIPVSVELLDGRVRASTQLEGAGISGTASATGPLRLTGGRLVFAPTEVEVDGGIALPPDAVAFDVRVPRLLPGLSYRSVIVEDGAVRVIVELRDTTLRVPPA